MGGGGQDEKKIIGGGVCQILKNMGRGGGGGGGATWQKKHWVWGKSQVGPVTRHCHKMLYRCIQKPKESRRLQISVNEI